MPTTTPTQELAFMFEKNKDFKRTAGVPASYLKRLRELREKGLISPKPNVVKLNFHSELAIEIKKDNGLTLEQLIKITDKKITPLNLNPIEIQTINHSVDVYRMFENDNCAQRLRLRFDPKGNIYMAIIIVTDLNSQGFRTWTDKEWSIVARKECVYAFNENPKLNDFSQEEYLENIKRVCKNFLENPAGKISHVVYKNTAKGKIIMENNGGLRSTKLTESEGVVGMNKFLSLTLEETYKYKAPCNLDNESSKKLLERIIENPLDTNKCFDSPCEQKLKIELESKGGINSKIAANMAKQLLEKNGILQKNKINFELENKRGFQLSNFSD